MSERDYSTNPLLPPAGPELGPGLMAPAETMPPAVRRRLGRLLADATYRFARTMPKNPHWYTLRRSWARDEDFTWAVEQMLRYGYRERFGRRWWGAIIIDGYKYWTCGWPAVETELINRKPVDAQGRETGAGPAEIATGARQRTEG